jgi:hypothetical protein
MRVQQDIQSVSLSQAKIKRNNLCSQKHWTKNYDNNDALQTLNKMMLKTLILEVL